LGLPPQKLCANDGRTHEIKEIGTTEIFATALLHSLNGHFVTVVGDGEYIIYTVLAWQNKVFSSGTGFTWAGDSNTYAVLESKVKLCVFKNFKERGDVGMKGT
jgi:coatomer subunit beta'